MSTCLLMRRTDRYMPRVKTEQMTVFGEVLEGLLDERGWNQETLSLATDPHVSQGMISNYKWGKRSPKRETIEAIARALVSGEADFDRRETKYSLVFKSLFRAVHSLEAIEHHPFIDDIIEAGVIEDLPPETQREILEYIKFKAQLERNKRGVS